MWGAVANVTIKKDEGRAICGLAKNRQRVLKPVDFVGVAHAENVPTVTEKSCRDVLRKGDARIAFDRDVIVVIDPAEVVQGEMARQRRCFGSHALHHAAIAANRVDVVAKDLEVGGVVTVGEPRLGYGHAHAGRNTLPKWSSCGLDPTNQALLGMTWSLAAELAKLTNIVERKRGLAKPVAVG